MSFAACQLSCSESHLWNKIFFSSHISNGWGLPHLHWETLIAVNDAAKDEHVASHLCVSKTQNMQILADHEHSTWKFCDTYNSWGGFLTRSCKKRVSGPGASRDVVPNAVVPARFFTPPFHLFHRCLFELTWLFPQCLDRRRGEPRRQPARSPWIIIHNLCDWKSSF